MDRRHADQLHRNTVTAVRGDFGNFGQESIGSRGPVQIGRDGFSQAGPQDVAQRQMTGKRCARPRQFLGERIFGH